MKKLLNMFVLMLMVTMLSTPFASFAQEDAPRDWCSDVEGVQLDIPGGYHRNEDGTCDAINLDGMPTQQIVDVCPNLSGDQEVVPAGHILVDNTNCMPDICPNLPGAQAKMPNNYYEGDGGECFLNLDIRFNTLDGIKLTTPKASGKYVYDACPNVWGIQGGVPAGYTKDVLTNRCTKKPVVDMCKNLKGNQLTVPKNHIRYEDGSCYNKSSDQKPAVKAVDRCSNIEGAQATIPEDHYQRDGATECIAR